MEAMSLELKACKDEIQKLSGELEFRHQALQAFAAELELKGERLNAILNSRAWKWVSRYGQVKNWLLELAPGSSTQRRGPETKETLLTALATISEEHDLEPGELIPPPKLQAYIGGGYRDVGPEFLRYFIDLCELKPNARVLDVGCGSGRMALPLTKYLSEAGSYEGFDISVEAVKWCRENITTRFPNFSFRVSDVRNAAYNTGANRSASEYSFTYQDESFDLVFLTSVFTHMLPADMDRYLCEIARVLKPGGKCLITFFLLNGESTELMATKAQMSLTFKHQIDGYRTINPFRPEDAVAYPEDFIRNLFNKRGLRIVEPIRFGSWCGRENFLTLQDIVISVKD